MITIFANFRRKNGIFSQKPMLWSNFAKKKTSCSLRKNRQFFGRNFWGKYF
jgi:hypothetical protein